MRHMPKAKKQRLSTYELSLMRAMHLKCVSQLDALLAAPTTQDAADHSDLPDDYYEWLDRAIEWQELEKRAQERFEALSETRYLN
jgi:hypothetical protein